MTSIRPVQGTVSLERSGKESMRRQVNIDKTGGRRIAKFQ